MIGTLWTTEDAAKHCGVSANTLSNIIRRDRIKPIGRASRVRLFLFSDVEKMAAGLANRRPYGDSPRPRQTVEEPSALPQVTDISDLSTALPRTGHVSAMGIALAAGTSEREAESAIKGIGIEVDHIDGTTPMYSVESVIGIVKALEAKHSKTA